jgi:hypothetical protein
VPRKNSIFFKTIGIQNLLTILPYVEKGNYVFSIPGLLDGNGLYILKMRKELFANYVLYLAAMKVVEVINNLVN